MSINKESIKNEGGWFIENLNPMELMIYTKPKSENVHFPVYPPLPHYDNSFSVMNKT